MVVYTGVETKLEQNLGLYKFKRSRTDKLLQYALLINLGLMIFFMLVFWISNFYVTANNYYEHEYIF